MTTPIRLPLYRWPQRWQCVLALAAVVAVGLGALAWVRVSDAGVLKLQRTLAHDTRTLEARTLDTRTLDSARLADARRALPAAPTGPNASTTSPPNVNTLATLLLRARADDVVRNAGREAQALGLAIRTLGVAQHAATPRAWGKVTFTGAAAGDYGAAKAWLAALLARSRRWRCSRW